MLSILDSCPGKTVDLRWFGSSGVKHKKAMSRWVWSKLGRRKEAMLQIEIRPEMCWIGVWQSGWLGSVTSLA